MQVVAVIILAFSLVTAHAAVASSEDYTLTVVATDSGGGRSISESYANDVSFGLIAGRSVANVAYVNAVGYVAQLNNPPRAKDDLRSYALNASVDILMAALVSNDTDPDRDPLSVLQFSVTSEAGGSIALVPPFLRYTPPQNFKGTDYFTYTVKDTNGDTDTATVAMIIAPPLDSQPINTLIIAQLQDGNYLVRFKGPPNKTEYSIEAADNLEGALWETILIARAGADGIVEIIIDPTQTKRRFFRALVI